MLIKQVFPESLMLPSQHCRYFFRGEQSAGDMENKVSGGASAVKNSGFLDATLWGTAGYATVGGTLGNYCTLAAAAHDFSLATHSMIFTLRIKKVLAAKPGAEQYIVSSYDPGTNTGGIIISCRTDGSARMYVNAADGTSVQVGTAADVVTDGVTPVERSLVWMFPRESGTSCQLGVDALPYTTANAATIYGKSFVGGRSMRIGQGQTASAIAAYQIAAFGCYALPFDLSGVDFRQVYDWAYRNPGAPMPDWVFA